MENRIRKHIEGMFAGAPHTAKARDLREEMIVNVIERYHDLLGEGLSEEDAYRSAITGIGDVSELIDSLKRDAAATGNQVPLQQPACAASAAQPQQPSLKKGLSTGAIVAIVICSTILLLTIIGGMIAVRVTGQLFSGDGFLSNMFNILKSENGISVNPAGFSFDNDEGFSNAYVETGRYCVSADGITSINVEWVAGSVAVCPAPSGATDITFTESASDTLSSKYALRYKISGNELTIRYCDSDLWRGIDWSDLLNSLKSPQKQLIVYIPASLLNGGLDQFTVSGVSNSLEVSNLTLADATFDAVSGSISITDCAFDRLDLENVSGTIESSGCSGTKITVNSISGNTEIGGGFSEYQLNSVSGSINAEAYDAVDGINAETVSGAITISTGGNYGFTATVDTVSGEFSSGSLPVSVQNGKYVYGDGSVKLDFETVSGNITVK